MAETTITGLPNASALDGTERVPMDQNGTTVDGSTQAIANLALADASAARTALGLGTADSPSFAGLTITGAGPVAIPHIHGNVAGSLYFHVKNTSGGQLLKGTPIRVTGAVGDTTTLQIAAADAANANTMPAVGILDATLEVNGEGHAVIAGEITELNTGSYQAGQTLWVASGGGLTNVRPTSNAQAVAIVGRVHASTGTVAVTIDAVAPTPPDDVIVIPVGDESTALATGTDKIKFRMPFAATLLAVRASVGTAPTGSTLIVDVNEAGVSVLGTKLSIDATEFSSTTAASAATITDSSLADDAEISIDVDQIGSTVAGAGLKVSLFVRRA